MHQPATATAAARALQTYFDTGYLGHAANLAAVIREWRPNGEPAWRQPSRDRAELEDALYDFPSNAGSELVVREHTAHIQFGPGRGVANVAAQSRNGSST